VNYQEAVELNEIERHSSFE